MDKIVGKIHDLHYTKYLERSGRISGTILIIIGLMFLYNGVRKIISYLHVRKTKYTIVRGKVTSWDKKVSHVKLSKKTEYFPILEFEYEGTAYKVKSKRSFGEETMTAFDLASKESRFEVRVPLDDPYDAVPNYELERNEKLYSGLCVSVFGLALIGIGLFFIVTRPSVDNL